MPGASTKQYIGVNKIHKGSGLIKDFYKGSTPVKMAYKGSNLIFDRRTLVLGTNSNIYSTPIPAAGLSNFDIRPIYTIFSYINNGIGTNIGNNAWSTSTSVQSNYASIPANTDTSARIYPIPVYTSVTDPFGTLQICTYTLPFTQLGTSISVTWDGQTDVYWGCWSDGITFIVYGGSTNYTITSVTWTGQPSYIDARHPSTSTVNFTLNSRPWEDTGTGDEDSMIDSFDITFTIKATVNGSTQTFTEQITFYNIYAFPLRFKLFTNGIPDGALSTGTAVFVTSASATSSQYYYVFNPPNLSIIGFTHEFSTNDAINQGWNYVNTILYTWNNNKSVTWNNEFILNGDTTILIPAALTPTYALTDPVLFFGFNSEAQTIANVTIIDSANNTYTPIKAFNYSGKDYTGFILSQSSSTGIFYTNHFRNPYTRSSVKEFSAVDYILTFT